MNNIIQRRAQRYFAAAGVSVCILSACTAVSPQTTLNGTMDVDAVLASLSKFERDSRKIQSENSYDSKISDQLRNKSFLLQQQAKTILKNQGVSIIPKLIDGLSGDQQSVCKSLLIDFGSASVVPVIEYARKTGDTKIAADILSLIGESAAPRLYPLLSSADEYDRELASEALLALAGLSSFAETSRGSSYHPSGWKPVMVSSAHCQEIAQQLKRENCPAVKPKLVILLGALALACPEVKKDMEELLRNDRDLNVRLEAAVALKRLAASEAPAAQVETGKVLVAQLSKEPDPEVRALILSAFPNMNIQAQPTAAVLRQASGDSINKVRLAALGALFSRCGQDKSIEKEVTEAARSSEPELRRIAREAMAINGLVAENASPVWKRPRDNQR